MVTIIIRVPVLFCILLLAFLLLPPNSCLHAPCLQLSLLPFFSLLLLEHVLKVAAASVDGATSVGRRVALMLLRLRVIIHE